MTEHSIRSRNQIRQRRRDLAILYRDLREQERFATQPIAMTPSMSEAGVSEDRTLSAREMRLRDCRQQIALAQRRIRIMTARRPCPHRPQRAPSYVARRPRQRRSHRIVAKSSSGDSGDDPPEPDGTRRVPSSGGAS